jgi:peroxiredoxin
MAQLRQDYDQFQAAGSEVLVVGPENADAFRKYWTENELPFRGLPDPEHRVLKQYGQEINLFKFGRMPAQVVINREGAARFVHYGKSMSDIPETAEVLELLSALNAETAQAA